MKKMVIIGLLLSFSGMSYAASAQGDDWELVENSEEFFDCEPVEDLSDWNLIEKDCPKSCLKGSGKTISPKKVKFFKQGETLQVPSQLDTAKKRNKKSTQEETREETREEKLGVISAIQEPRACDFHPSEYAYDPQLLPLQEDAREKNANKRMSQLLNLLYGGNATIGTSKKLVWFKKLKENNPDMIAFIVQEQDCIDYVKATDQDFMNVVTQYLRDGLNDPEIDDSLGLAQVLYVDKKNVLMGDLQEKRKEFLTFLLADCSKKAELYEQLTESFPFLISKICAQKGIDSNTTLLENQMPFVVAYLKEHMHEEDLGLDYSRFISKKQ